uniref:hybrid sensor histidine kinase/response regulator transcription factor n=1 Tax=Prevotella sp. TaxID=59823 RepID=UPI003FF0FB08
MVLGFVLLLQPLQMRAALQNIEFSSLNNRDGLSNSQVNAILKDKTGYVWFGTQSGLNRFDGFRMKTFLYSATNQTSLANNYVDELQEDNEGKIWVHTSVGYCVYDPTTEQFDRKPEVWLKTINVEGVPQRLLVDSQKNMWIQVWGKGLYYYNVKNETTYLFKYVKKPKSGCLMDGDISSLKDVDGKLLVTYGDGMLCLLDGDKQSALWYNTFLKDHRLCGDNGAYSFVENNHTFWVSTTTEAYVFNSLNRQWLSTRSYLAQRGILVPVNDRIVIRDLQVNANGALWVATDHHGLFYIDFKTKACHQYVHSNVRGSIVDNSLQKVYIDNFGAVWVGSYKNGVAYYSPSSSKFNTIPLGDVCTITQDLAGNLWCGTNAHLESMRVAPVIATVHKAEDTMEETVEEGGSSDALYGVHRSSQTAKPTRKNYVAKVLLVDDSDDFREFMRDVLTDYQVIEAVNGQDAWQKIIEVRPDVILSDVMMPVMDGIELCRMVKSNEETASIPFVMLTARLAAEHRVEGLESGADDYITKPFNIDMLNLRIRNLLGWARRSARRSFLDKNKEEKKDSSQPKERAIPKGELGDFEMTANDRKFLADVDKYIKDMMGDPDTSVESMSAHLCMSRVQLYKRMVSLTGTTPSEYLRAKRIKRAEELIHSDELNISEIAYTVGFNNPRYFSKYFQEAYGLTPSQYKKKLNGESI